MKKELLLHSQNIIDRIDSAKKKVNTYHRITTFRPSNNQEFVHLRNTRPRVQSAISKNEKRQLYVNLKGGRFEHRSSTKIDEITYGYAIKQKERSPFIAKIDLKRDKKMESQYQNWDFNMTTLEKRRHHFRKNYTSKSVSQTLKAQSINSFKQHYQKKMKEQQLQEEEKLKFRVDTLTGQKPSSKKQQYLICKNRPNSVQNTSIRNQVSSLADNLSKKFKASLYREREGTKKQFGGFYITHTQEIDRRTQASQENVLQGKHSLKKAIQTDRKLDYEQDLKNEPVYAPSLRAYKTFIKGVLEKKNEPVLTMQLSEAKMRKGVIDRLNSKKGMELYIKTVEYRQSKHPRRGGNTGLSEESKIGQDNDFTDIMQSQGDIYFDEEDEMLLGIRQVMMIQDARDKFDINVTHLTSLYNTNPLIVQE